jgi:hypothetical protein
LRIVVPERKRKLPVQAINGRCMKCAYCLAWVLVPQTNVNLYPISVIRINSMFFPK